MDIEPEIEEIHIPENDIPKEPVESKEEIFELDDAPDIALPEYTDIMAPSTPDFMAPL